MEGVTADDAPELLSPEQVVPLFPLTGVLLLPGNFLPLNIFEPRYRNLVEDALAGARKIGMVQPRVPALDNSGPVAAVDERPGVYEVGCIGRIARCERQADGRFLILLRGERRFRIESELSPLRGYRRAVAAFDEFSSDALDGGDDPTGDELLPEALDFARRLELDFDPDLLASLTPVRLLNVLAAALPFGPMEKQALLEAPTADARQDMLLALMRMAPLEGVAASPPSSDLVH